MLTWDEVIRRADHGNVEPPRRVEKTDDERRAQLDPAAYQVTRHAATERAFSSDMCSLFGPGRYACVCCGELLFDAAEKFESGTGWPSFTQPITDDVVGTPPNWLSLGYGTDVATPTAQDLFDEAMRSKRKLPYL